MPSRISVPTYRSLPEGLEDAVDVEVFDAGFEDETDGGESTDDELVFDKDVVEGTSVVEDAELIEEAVDPLYPPTGLAVKSQTHSIAVSGQSAVDVVVEFSPDLNATDYEVRITKI